MKPAHQTIAGAACVAVLLAASVVWTRRMVIDNRASQLATLRQEFDSLRQLTADPTFAQDLEQLRIRCNRYQGSGSIQAEVAKLLQHLAADLESLGLYDASVTTGVTSTTDGVQRVPLGLSFKGAFATVFEVTRRLGEYERLIQVERLAIARDSAAPLDALSVSMQLNAFVSAPEEVR